LHGEAQSATWGSFLTVDPEYRRQGVARKMHAEFQRRHQQREAAVNFGYHYVRHIKSLGPKFWRKQPDSAVGVRKLGMWVRALEHRAVARFETYWFEAYGSRMLSLVQGRAEAPRDMTGIRPYRSDDLADCMELVAERASSVDLAYHFSADELSRLLDYGGFSRTVVLERDGRIAGLIAYYPLHVLGRRRLEVAIIDVLAFGSLPSRDRQRLLQAALCRMTEEGIQAAMCLRGSWYAWPQLARTGFYPVGAEYYFCGNKMRHDLSLDRVRRLHVLWR
jgi:hypothetical protein